MYIILINNVLNKFEIKKKKICDIPQLLFVLFIGVYFLYILKVVL